MRRLTEHRRRRPGTRERSRFGPGARPGNRDLVRFRRNRELLAREVTVFVLWIAVAVMLVHLAQTLWQVSQTHLAERSAVLRNLLPALPALAILFCGWRARQNLREIREIRSEQVGVRTRLASIADDDA